MGVFQKTLVTLAPTVQTHKLLGYVQFMRVLLRDNNQHRSVIKLIEGYVGLIQFLSGKYVVSHVASVEERIINIELL